MRKLRCLDLFCGAGGAARGLQLAGFHVTGVDIKPQPRYIGDTFIQGDAMEYPLDGFDFIWASPPCQAFTNMTNWDNRKKASHPNYIAKLRRALRRSKSPYVIENVVSAPLENPIMLCGAMFGLRVYRHRLFESNRLLWAPVHPKHIAKASKASRIPKEGEFWCPVGCFGQKDSAQRAMGIDWMKTTGSRDTEIAQAIPPAYSKYIAEQFLSSPPGVLDESSAMEFESIARGGDQ